MNTNTSCTFQELGVLFNSIIKSWKAHPNHFGSQSFDDFLKSLPNFYYHLINYQHQIQQQLRQQQQQQQNIIIQQQQQMIKEQQLKQQQLKEQQLKEQQLREKQLKEQQLKEQQLKEQKMREQQLKEQQLKEQQLKEQQEKEGQQKKELIVVVDSNESNNTKKEENSLKLAQKQRNYRSRSSIQPRLGSIDEEKPLTPISSCSPFSSPSVSPIPPSIANLNAAAPEFVPSFDSNDSENDNGKEQKTTTTKTNKPYKILEKFVPFHAARAKLNIYIPKHMTKSVLSMIDETFPNTNTLYYYLDISTAIQINDGQMDVIQCYYYFNEEKQEKQEKKIVLINFDLHKKGTKEILYAVVTPNDKHKIETNTHKWLWKLEEFLTQNELFNKYQITSNDLPNSSRLMKNGIYDQYIKEKQKLNEINFISLLKKYKWNSNEIKIIGSSQKSKKNKKNHEIKLTLDSNLWINLCINSLNIDNIPLIPIVVYENRDINKHWIEWVKLIYIQQKNSFVGLTFKYNDNNNDDNKWQIESVCLDRGDIHNKHRLIGLQNINLHNNDNKNNGQCINIINNNNNYDEYFNKFNTTITEIEWQ